MSNKIGVEKSSNFTDGLATELDWRSEIVHTSIPSDRNILLAEHDRPQFELIHLHYLAALLWSMQGLPDHKTSSVLHSTFVLKNAHDAAHLPRQARTGIVCSMRNTTGSFKASIGTAGQGDCCPRVILRRPYLASLWYKFNRAWLYSSKAHGDVTQK